MAINENDNILVKMDHVELGLISEDLDYAREVLKDEGFNLDEGLAFSKKKIAKLRFINTALKNKSRDENLFEKAMLQIKKVIEENASKTTEVLIGLLHKKAPAVQYRKLEEWTENEIREVLTDIDLIEIMEELDKKI